MGLPVTGKWWGYFYLFRGIHTKIANESGLNFLGVQINLSSAEVSEKLPGYISIKYGSLYPEMHMSLLLLVKNGSRKLYW